MAPGSAIVSASHTSNTGTRSLSGTSMACPHVSGAAALLLQGNSAMTSPDILASMLATARAGLISGLKENDPDALLWVSAVDAPHPCKWLRFEEGMQLPRGHAACAQLPECCL